MFGKKAQTLRAFDYVAAKDAGDAANLLWLEGRRAAVLAGGTDLIVQLREGGKSVGLLVDIKGVSEANTIDFDQDGGLCIGAAVPCWRICDEPAVVKHYPGLLDAVSLIGGTQIQGRATVGGNLCNASPAADSIPALIALGAVCTIASRDGRRDVPVEGFCVAPGKTVLCHGEFLLSIRLPHPPRHTGASYIRFTPRNEMDIAVVGVGVSVRLDEGRRSITSARIVLGAVGPTPLLAEKAGEVLVGEVLVEGECRDMAIVEAARLARETARPISDVRGTEEQRRHLVGVLARRAIATAIQRANER